MNWDIEKMNVIRQVADEMWESRKKCILPGWDPERLDERARAIRTAAMGVYGSLDPDGCVRVTERELGALLRYIVDIMEP